jgi:hypothetical protein
MPTASIPAATIAAYAGAAAAAASAAVGAYSAISQGRAQSAAAEQQAEAQSNAAKYQAQVAANNQTIANQNAATATQYGNNAEAAKRTQISGVIGAQRAAVAANNLSVNSGSALDLQAGTSAVGELDAQTIRDSTARTARGYQVQGLDYQAQAGLDRMTADNALQAGALKASAASSAGGMNAFSSILGGASSVADKWMKYRNDF